MSNYINKYLTQSAFDADNTKQYPNTALIGNKIVFTKTEPSFNGLTVKYNITQESTQYEVSLFNGGGESSGSSESGSSESGGGGVLPSKMYVDGVEETPINTWRFTTVGEHIVQYEFADNIVPQSFIDANAATATDVIVGTDITEISPEAFNKELTSATCLSTTPPTMSTNTSFGLEQDYPIYVPAESVNTYKTEWSSIATRIEAIQ
jgi:hypothetical protein